MRARGVCSKSISQHVRVRVLCCGDVLAFPLYAPAYRVERALAVISLFPFLALSCFKTSLHSVLCCRTVVGNKPACNVWPAAPSATLCHAPSLLPQCGVDERAEQREQPNCHQHDALESYSFLCLPNKPMATGKHSALEPLALYSSRAEGRARGVGYPGKKGGEARCTGGGVPCTKNRAEMAFPAS